MLKSAVIKSASFLGLEIRRRSSGTWAAVMSRCLQSVLDFDGVATAFDVGAFEGETAALFLSWFPNARVHAFEPFESSYATLSSRIASVPRASALRAAVAEAAGEAEFFVTKSEQSNSILRPLQTGRDVDGSHRTISSIRVQKTSLDVYCEEMSVDRVDVLKLDVQGGELAALKGSDGLLSRGAIKAIISEVEFVELYDHQPLFCDITAYLKGYGYSLYAIPRQVPDEIGQLCWADAVFFRNDILDDARAKAQRRRP